MNFQPIKAWLLKAVKPTHCGICYYGRLGFVFGIGCLIGGAQLFASIGFTITIMAAVLKWLVVNFGNEG